METTTYTADHKVLDHGYVRYLEHMGTDKSIVADARLSYRSKGRDEAADRKLIRYLFRHRHTSPFEMGKIKFNIKLPIFVMRQLVRHRMQNLNEVSARYTELSDEFFVPDMWRVQDTKNKQSSLVTELWGPEGPTISIDDGNPWRASSNVTATKALISHCKQSYELYQKLIASGIAREQARVVLPMNIYTEIVSCMDVHNLINFLVKRRAPGAQKEIQVFADAMFAIANDLFPWTMEEFVRCEKSMRRVWGDDETYGVY